MFPIEGGANDTHFQPTPSQEHVRGYTLGEMTPQFKLSLQMQHKVSSWTEAAAFSVTTILYLAHLICKLATAKQKEGSCGKST